MEKVKAFFTNHKKAIIIGTAVVVTAAVGAIAYKLHLDKTQAIESIAESDAAEQIILETMNSSIK